MNAILIEDNVKAQELITGLLKRHFPAIHLAGIASGKSEGRALILESRPRLLLLDIQLRDGSVFDLLENLPAEILDSCALVFITAFGTFENIYRAMRLSAIDYLVKPIDEDHFCRAVSDAAERINHTSLHDQLTILYQHLGRGSLLPTPLKIPVFLTKSVIEYLPVGDILYIQADENISHFHLSDGRTLHSVRHLGFYRQSLDPNSRFFQISKSILANLDHLARYHVSEQMVEMTDGSRLPASRRMGSALWQFLKEGKWK